MAWEILQGDVRDKLQDIPDNTFDACITDPPYELGFMGKSWDSTGIAYNVEMWKEVLRVLKPGGHLLSFGGSRTYHRMACAIEDAGFEIRDQIMWLYGSGFPKSHNISKSIDRAAGAGREVVATVDYRSAFNCSGTHQAFEGETHSSPMNITNPTTPEAKQWEGWGTALKPAHEPIVLARKPLSEKTIAGNVLKWGTGGINIDKCRVETDPRVDDMLRNVTRGKRRTDTWEEGSGFKNESNHLTGVKQEGRFPANLIHDGSEEVLEEFAKAGDRKAGGKVKGHEPSRTGDNGIYGKWDRVENKPFDDSGTAARFFYCAKSSKSERGEGNNHPTVKPVKLMEYLIKLVTPPGGKVLDPFAGSGTTLLAAEDMGINSVGVEITPEYVKLIEKRMSNFQQTIFSFAP